MALLEKIDKMTCNITVTQCRKHRGCLIKAILYTTSKLQALLVLRRVMNFQNRHKMQRICRTSTHRFATTHYKIQRRNKLIAYVRRESASTLINCKILLSSPLSIITCSIQQPPTHSYLLIRRVMTCYHNQKFERYVRISP